VVPIFNQLNDLYENWYELVTIAPSCFPQYRKHLPKRQNFQVKRKRFGEHCSFKTCKLEQVTMVKEDNNFNTWTV